ncbi:hypothetical protein [uncultured Phenylobacterium sp.]|uniref:hypothetical protein n=1 Tax=uncultured Phenylobacterium sp. TaxID=349273 RepID=UPI0025F0C447|nr:hypothetical protein [uncultured Phenylobacterium sp.]
MSYDFREFLPEKVGSDIAFAAMVHFLATHFNEVGGSEEVVAFLRSISIDELGRPIGDEVFARFENAIVDADRWEMIDLLRGPR